MKTHEKNQAKKGSGEKQKVDFAKVCPLQQPGRYDALMHTAVASMRLFDGNNPVDPKLGCLGKPVDLFRKGKAKFHMVRGQSPFGPLWFHIYESVIGMTAT